MTSEDMSNATSSPASADGPTPSASPDGPATGQCGPEAVPVSRFRARDSEKAMPTSATSGPLFNALSPSAALTWSLGSKLVANLAGSGSPLYRLIWSQQDMPSGPQIFRLRASALHISGSDFTGWPTPNAGPLNDTDTKWQERRKAAKETHNNGNGFGMNLGMAVQLSGWPSPLANKQSPQQRGDFTPNLANVAQLTGWPTPTAQDTRQYSQESLEKFAAEGQASGHFLDFNAATQLVIPLATLGTNADTPCDATTGADLLLDVAEDHCARSPTDAQDNLENVLLSGWPTPAERVRSGESMEKRQGRQMNLADVAGWATPRSTEAGHSTGNPERAIDNKSRLEDQVFLAGWATPSSRDWKDTPGMATKGVNPDGTERNRADQLPREAHGVMSNGSPAPTEKPGQLNPEFTRWLQGFPETWLNYAP